MSRKSRLLRIAATALFLVAFVGYFAFSTFFFKPFESGLSVDVSGLAPRDVDFFVARAGLRNAFEKFPRLAVADEIEDNETWRTWEESPERARFYESIGLRDSLAELERMTARMPLGLQPLDVVGGRDLALAGRFQGASLEQAEWALYGTLNWAGKLAVEVLAYEGLHGLADQGISIEESGDHVVISGGQLPRPLYVTRIKDVAVVATSKKWIDDAFENRQRGFQDSFYQRALYADHVFNADRSRERDEVEFFVNTRQAFESLGRGGDWPNPSQGTPAERFLARYFRAGMLNRMVGLLAARSGVDLRLHGELSSELMTTLQTQNYRIDGADHGELHDRILPYVPQDTALFAYGKLRAGDLLRTIFEVMEPATRDLIEDTLAESGKYTDLDALVGELEGALKNRFALIVRENDYPVHESDPPNDGRPVFAVALLAWMNEPETIRELRTTIGHMGSRIGLQPIDPSHSSGFYRNEVGGYTQYEYTSPAIPGTGVIVTQNTPDGICIVSNSVYMLDHLLKTSTQGAPSHPRLTDRVDFTALLDDSLPKGQITLWADPRKAAPTFRKMSQRWAEDSIVIDWRLERAKAEAQVIREHFPGEQQGQLSPAVQTEVDKLVDPILEELEDRVHAEQIPALKQDTLRRIRLSEAVTASLLRINFTQRTLDLSLRVVTPLE